MAQPREQPTAWESRYTSLLVGAARQIGQDIESGIQRQVELGGWTFTKSPPPGGFSAEVKINLLDHFSDMYKCNFEGEDFVVSWGARAYERSKPEPAARALPIQLKGVFCGTVRGSAGMPYPVHEAKADAMEGGLRAHPDATKFEFREWTEKTALGVVSYLYTLNVS